MTRRLRALARLGPVFACLLLAACGVAENMGLVDAEDPSAPPGIPYGVDIEGSMPDAVRSYLLAASDAAQATDRPPSSALVLRRRAEDDLDKLRRALRAQGYYEGDVSFEIVRPEPDEAAGSAAGEIARDVENMLEGPPTRIVYRFDMGPRFTFADRRVEMTGDPHGFKPPRLADLGLKAGEPAVAEQVLNAERALVRAAQQEGFAFAEIGDRSIVVDYDADVMNVDLTLALGERVTFGVPEIAGIDGIDEDYVRGRIPFEAGDQYDVRKIEEARTRLLDSELFSTIKISPAKTADEDGRLPVAFEMTQRKHRTIGAGLGYLSGEGPNARLFWEHRNFLGGGERLRIEAGGSASSQEAKANFRKRDFFMPDLALIADGSIKNEDTDAFSSRSIGAGLGVERTFNNHVSGTLGVAYRYAEIKENGKDDDVFGLISVPATLALDYSDNLLDPSEGWRLDLRAAPFWDTLGLDTRFLKGRATATWYYRLANDPRLVFATRGSVGSITGVSRDQIPADERFYAGGGGSVRGIPYQLAGPLDDGEPLGGRSVLEGSVELRWRAFTSVELVSFLDAGSVFGSSVPATEGDLEMGTGVGFRYVTPVGPFRFDIAVPIDKRKGIDDSFQFYVSIGQAF
ncbi:MAG: outer membrane protein assembly factor [Geminicoccaceae bacterium]|nr:outer membrane protein assembly factor [Geminicoccaceae bacterium]